MDKERECRLTLLPIPVIEINGNLRRVNRESNMSKVTETKINLM